jgi:hypothetical protein
MVHLSSDTSTHPAAVVIPLQDQFPEGLPAFVSQLWSVTHSGPASVSGEIARRQCSPGFSASVSYSASSGPPDTGPTLWTVLL